jgi:hypothetical protein
MKNVFLSLIVLSFFVLLLGFTPVEGASVPRKVVITNGSFVVTFHNGASCYRPHDIIVNRPHFIHRRHFRHRFNRRPFWNSPYRRNGLNLSPLRRHRSSPTILNIPRQRRGRGNFPNQNHRRREHLGRQPDNYHRHRR